jgi:hypothetical protein
MSSCLSLVVQPAVPLIDQLLPGSVDRDRGPAAGPRDGRHPQMVDRHAWPTRAKDRR